MRFTEYTIAIEGRVMADIVSLSELRLLAQQRADMENSQFITDDEWRRMINRSYAELYDLIVTSANSEDYFLTSGTINLVSGTSTYDLPTDFYKSRGVDLNTGGAKVPLRRYNFSERNVGGLYSVASDMRYHIQSNSIVFNHEPSSADTISVSAMWEAYILSHPICATTSRVIQLFSIQNLAVQIQSQFTTLLHPGNFLNTQ